MPQKHTDKIPYGYVYKVTFPNGKTYIGSDTAATAEYDYYKYMGSPIGKTKALMHSELQPLLNESKRLTLTKVLLYEARDCTVAHIKSKEREFIKLTDSTNREVGYNFRAGTSG